MKKNRNDSNSDVDNLFKLPLTEFTNARNALAADLKKSGRGGESATVKAFGKPSVSAWAVNQLYWNHREAFDKLTASGERFHKAQKSGKMSEMRTALDARREALTQLSNVAASLLKNGGHNPSPDTIHRITTTLEGISAYASRDDGPQAGRLTHDVDPPGFESVGSFVPAKQETVERGGRSRRQAAGAEKQKAEGRKQKANTAELGGDSKRKEQETNAKEIAAAKASVQEARRMLAEANTRVRSLAAARTRTQADLKQAEERFKEATKRARAVDDDLELSTARLKDAERRLEQASMDLETANRSHQ
ncbi:MAG TPA: hypothetical protein VJV03_08950 [Pyrinomonadaceae bacterium]|nr:hypothetical protein [Pyrinomonadaceae bacterium]